MKTILMVTILSAIVSLESIATGQLIPRRNITRPCPTYRLPQAQYQIDDRSRSAEAFSYRYVYLDNPVEELNQDLSRSLSQTINITTITTETEIFGSGAKLNPASIVPDSTAPPANSALAGTATQPEKVIETTTKKTQSMTTTPNNQVDAIRFNKKLFQWRENKLQIDHCEISNMAVQLSRDGEWRLNLRADQNRRDPNQRFNPSLYIKRNQFGIVLRRYGNMATDRAVTDFTTGQPVLVEIPVERFWVQNGKPNFFVIAENDSSIAQNFDLIDRVEIEFFYYK